MINPIECFIGIEKAILTLEASNVNILVYCNNSLTILFTTRIARYVTYMELKPN